MRFSLSGDPAELAAFLRALRTGERLPLIAGGAPPTSGLAVAVVDGSGNQSGLSTNMLAVNPGALSAASDSISQEGQNPTYAIVSGAFTPGSGTTRDFIEFDPSASLVWRLHLLKVWGHGSGATVNTFVFQLRSTLNSGGVLAGSQPTLIPRLGQTTLSTVTSGCKTYTTQPTSGTGAGQMGAFIASVPAAASATPIIDWCGVRDEGNTMLPRMAINYGGSIALNCPAGTPTGFVVDGFVALASEGAN